MNVPLLDLKLQYATIRDEIGAAMQEVIDAQWFIMGPVVQGFEADMAAYTGTNRAVGCASGSDALLLALMAIDVGPGDEVICPPYTFFATAGSIHRLGATPVFADIDPVTYNIDPASVREVARGRKRLKGIMPVHLFGQAAPMSELLEIGEESGVPVIEDAAQAIGTRDDEGRTAGSIGSIGCFSFFPSKNLGAFGDAGICTTNDEGIAHRIGILRNHGMDPKYVHELVGLNSRLDALQAAVLRVKLKHLDAWTEGRRANAAWYDDAFADAGAVTSMTPLHDGGFPLRTPHRRDPARGARHIYNQYVIRVPASIRDGLREALREQGVGTEVYYPIPLHRQACFAHLGHKEGDFPHAEQAARETIALPIYAELTEAQRRHVTSAIVDYVTTHAGVATP